MIHQPETQPATEWRRTKWGHLEAWLRKPGECISTGYVIIHAVNCGFPQYPASQDRGSVFVRAFDETSDKPEFIVGCFYDGTDLEQAIAEHSRYSRSLIDGALLAVAAAQAKKVRT